MTVLSVFDFDDHRHVLDSTQHEACYFQFASRDGQLFGFLRTLFGQSDMLEIVALRVEGRTWVSQGVSPLPGGPTPSHDASGPTLKLACLEPWAKWKCIFDGPLTDIASRHSASFALDFQFHADGPPTRYQFGPYQQVQQDGVMSGSFRLDGQPFGGEFLCSRDRSWGQRQMHIAEDWIVASLPRSLYLAVIHIDGQQHHFGHFFLPDGQREAFRAPAVSADGNGWRIADDQTDAGVWQVERVTSPFVVHLGPPGQEAVRLEAHAGDLYRDEIGPAMYTAPDGRRIPGFLERARRVG